MPDPLVVTAPPVTSMDEAMARMAALAAALPADDGVACFNRVYLAITELVRSQVSAGFFADPVFLAHLDVAFANRYFDVVGDAATEPTGLARSWAPLFQQRSDGRIEPIQFAFAGMNAHINHDLALAVVDTCTALATSPGTGSHHDDYCRVNDVLASAETSIRRSFEDDAERRADVQFQAAADLVCNWSIVEARGAAWTNAEALWELRRIPRLAADYAAVLDGTVGMASRALLVRLA